MKRYWLSFDLGLRGPYEELYQWLDDLQAQECGDSVATFQTEKTREQIVDELKKFLNEKSRVYIVDTGKGGRFVFGRRKKNAPWTGYAKVTSDFGDENDDSYGGL